MRETLTSSSKRVTRGRRSWLLVGTGLLILSAGAERIVSWGTYGYVEAQSPSFPAAYGTQALITGILVLAFGAWLVYRGWRGSHRP